jgi:hypothetical protein
MRSRTVALAIGVLLVLTGCGDGNDAPTGGTVGEERTSLNPIESDGDVTVDTPDDGDDAPTNDIVSEERTSFNLIGSDSDVTCEDPDNTLDPALTIAGATFVQDGDEMVVAITFEGDAEAYEEATTDPFPVAVQFRLEDGGPYPEVFFGDKGHMKVAGASASVSYELSDDTLVMELVGFPLDDVVGVQVSTFVFAGGTCEHLVFSAGYNY